ncbi:BRISC and BRCA1-A complex member 1-like [Amphiura filiformis]|uniref:BRISC and BRCA1-A complex member 1-like n=1 Tax=Amphiura filiformis TaxID=82378 RepID=UPI003B227D2A
MSEEEKSSDNQEFSAPSAAANISKDYDIIEDDAVLSNSPNYQSVAKTGQVIPVEKDQSSSQESIGKGSSAATDVVKQVEHPTTSGSSELNPFAKGFVPRVSESGDTPPPIPPHHADQADAFSGSRLQDPQVEGDLQQVEEQLLPRVNCPEKIIICLDLSSEVNRVPFISRDFTKYQPLDLIKRALNIFVKTKNTMNPLHEYALVLLHDSAVWMQDFTSDVDEFFNVLQDSTNETQDSDGFDLTSLFDQILEKVDLPFVEDMLVLPPPYIVRTIFIYGRSNCIPGFLDGRESQRQLSNSPYFFFDVFYVHEPPSDDNLCKEVYDVFLDLDSNNTSYIHEVGRNTTHLHNKMAMLLGHPLQRPIQMQASHSLNPPGPS